VGGKNTTQGESKAPELTGKRQTTSHSSTESCSHLADLICNAAGPTVADPSSSTAFCQTANPSPRALPLVVQGISPGHNTGFPPSPQFNSIRSCRIKFDKKA